MESNSTSATEWLAPHSSTTDLHQRHTQTLNKIGIYGWRKRCLYLFISILMVMVIINMALTLWILKVLDFSISGMGKLRILENGMRLEGDAEFLHGMHATSIKARKAHSIKIESARNLTLNARNLKGEITTKLFLGDQKFEVIASNFTVYNTKGKILFSSTDNEVQVAAEMLHVAGSGGAVFNGSVQTPKICSDYKTDLRIESPTRALDFDCSETLSMESRAGEIQASSLMDLKLQSTHGYVKLDSEKIYMRTLPKSEVSSSSNQHTNAASQLCICHTGVIFLAPASGHCVADEATCRLPSSG